MVRSASIINFLSFTWSFNFRCKYGIVMTLSVFLIHRIMQFSRNNVDCWHFNDIFQFCQKIEKKMKTFSNQIWHFMVKMTLSGIIDTKNSKSTGKSEEVRSRLKIWRALVVNQKIVNILARLYPTSFRNLF